MKLALTLAAAAGALLLLGCAPEPRGGEFLDSVCADATAPSAGDTARVPYKDAVSEDAH